MLRYDYLAVYVARLAMRGPPRVCIFYSLQTQRLFVVHIVETCVKDAESMESPVDELWLAGVLRDITLWKALTKGTEQELEVGSFPVVD